MAEWVKVGTVGVDSASLWLGDPAYPPEPGRTMIDVCGNARYCDRKTRTDYGFYFSTLHGDGEYPVYAEFGSGGRITRLMVDLDGDPEDGDA